MRSGRRRSSKQDANLFIMPIARSVAPSSNAPASEVTGPASNAATTLRPSTGANSKKFGVQSVGIGVLRESEINCCCTTIFADSQPRCTQFGERSALGDALDHAARRGVIVGAAAGNQGTMGSTAITRHPWVIPVVACDVKGRPTKESNLGRSIGRGGLRAPGDGITSLGARGEPVTLGGTSVAAPFVTGAIAPVWSEFPDATAAEMK